MGFLSYLFGILSLLHSADAVLLKTGIAEALPWFTGAGAAVTGLLIAVVWYFEIKATEKAKKHRAKAFAAMLFDVIACILAVSLLIMGILETII
ncbi:MAG: hypothetical protein IJB30_00100 [Clostridia bacterium]|nr:hypothetical protein [Clostridia bacterium]